jgi:hypothetical protein
MSSDSSSPSHGGGESVARMLRRTSLVTSKRLRKSSQEALEEIQRNVTPREVLKEALKAGLIWLVIDLFLFVILLSYKWQTKNYYNHKKGVNDLTQHSAQLKDLLKRYDKVLLEQASQRDHVRQHQSKLMAKTGPLKEFDFTNAEEPRDGPTVRLGTVNFVKLLMQSSLSEASFPKAMNDLTGLIHSKDTVDWLAVDQVLKRDFPEKLASKNPFTSCSAVKANVPKDTARISDLEDIINEFNDLFEGRIEYSPLGDDQDYTALMPSSQIMANRWIKSQTENLVKTIVSASQKQGSTGIKPKDQHECMNEGKIMMLVEVGLTALLRKADLRNVLRSKAMQLDPSAKSIILDADLPPARPISLAPSKLQLRRIIDKPILYEIIDWIDQLVEISGGYSDVVDQYLDSLAGNAMASIGEIFMNRLLEESKKIELPHPKPLADKFFK